jgi:hypothetical protein
MERKDCEQVSPFKFNPNWLEYEEFHRFINNEWISYDVCLRETESSRIHPSYRTKHEVSALGDTGLSSTCTHEISHHISRVFLAD